MRTAGWVLLVLLGLALVAFSSIAGGVLGVAFGVVLFALGAAGVLRLIAPEPGAGGEDPPGDREVLADTLHGHPDVSPTGDESAGEPVYETRVDGRTVTAEAVHTDSGRAVRVATPLRVTRPGVGFRLREEAGTLGTVNTGPTDVRTGEPEDLLRRARRALLDLETVGELHVDDRLGTVAHTTDRLEDAAGFRRQARAVVDVATAVETATEGPGGAGPTERESVGGASSEAGGREEAVERDG